jgi:hypothetical protein
MRLLHREAQSVPRLLKRAVRWSVMGVAGAALAGQLMGVALITPAQAGIDGGLPDPNCIRCEAQFFQCLDARDCLELGGEDAAACFAFCESKALFCFARHGCGIGPP